MINQENYLDFKSIFINEISGSVVLFILLGELLLLYVCYKCQVKWQAQMLLSIIWFSIIMEFSRLYAIWAFMLLLIGVGFYYWLSGFFKR